MFYQQKATTWETHTKVIMGINCVDQLPAEIKQRAPKAIMVVSDPGVSATAFYTKCLSYIDSTNIPYSTFTKVEAEAPLRNVNEVLDIMKKTGAELAIAIGGGSTIDVTKLATVLATNGGKGTDWAGYERYPLPGIPFFTVPTTAGTSSEVTNMAVIHDEDTNIKFTVGHATYGSAKVTFLDGSSLASCPPKIIAVCGIDAMSHSFESFISLKANPMTEATSLQGVRLIAKNLRTVYANSENVFAAQDLLIGSTMGGMAFTATGCGHMHNIGRFVGPKFHVNHGTSIALVMPSVARFNFPAQMEKYRQLADALGEKVDNVPDAQIGEVVAGALRQLIEDVGIHTRLSDFNPTHSDFEEIADSAMVAYKAHYHLKNPRKTSRQDFIDILEDCCR
ncbi:MAG: iron-containing alcohol dehydrogenase [Clostridia bacterium]|nr:iron-containing alcohol dehydrogenase [Clostridia bacterium]